MLGLWQQPPNWSLSFMSPPNHSLYKVIFIKGDAALILPLEWCPDTMDWHAGSFVTFLLLPFQSCLGRLFMFFFQIHYFFSDSMLSQVYVFLRDFFFSGILSLFSSFKTNSFFFFCKLIYFNWRLISLQYCGGFCRTFTRISHGCACVTHPEFPSHLPPHPIPQGFSYCFKSIEANSSGLVCSRWKCYPSTFQDSIFYTLS